MTSATSQPQILVVDDDPGILHATSRILAPHYRVKCLASAAEALALDAGLVPDVAILDIRMPELNGFELMQRLRELIPGVDFILMTGNAEEPDANLVQAIDAGAFYFIQKPFERRVLLALVGRCLELRRLRQEKQRLLDRLRDELDQAKRFQSSLLPPGNAQIGRVSIAARYHACGELAGDIYDYAKGEGGQVALVIADVVRHGASAAMLTGLVKSAFRAAKSEAYDPMEVVRRVREGILAFEGDRFVTLFCGRIDPVSGRMHYVSAGHPPPIVRRQDGSLISLDSTGPLVSSVFAEFPCEQESVPIAEGDKMILYTDGVTDASGVDGLFGHERFSAVAAEHHATATAALEALEAAITDHRSGRPLQDDMTLLVAQIRPP